jgi:hypothetical protein
MGILNQMFGIASATAYVRAGGSGNLSRNLIASLAGGFGGDTGNGVYVHDLFASDTGIFTQSGFDNSSLYYNTVESNVQNISYPCSIGVAAIIYSHANLPNVPGDATVSIINSFCEKMQVFGYGSQTQFTKDNLYYTLSQFSLTDVNDEIANIPKQKIEKAVNYNWYDAEPLFINPNFSSMSQLIKDTECQYYYISGELLYSDLPTGLKPCVYYNSIVSTPTGDMMIQKIQTIPCVPNNSYVGPTSGTVFFRKFVDGPGSSGVFSPEVMEAYVWMERNGNKRADWSTNREVIYSSKVDENGLYIPIRSGVVIDDPGCFQSGREYGFGHTNMVIEGCTDHPAWPLPVRMHQGDNRKKIYLESWNSGPPDNECLQFTGEFDWTGWKLVQFELKPELASQYRSYKTNPAIDTERVIKRVFDLNNSVDEYGNPVTPYSYVSDTGDGKLTCGEYGWEKYYVGPPQLNGNSSLPGFAFYQTFDNVNFPSGGETGTVVIRPMITIGDSSFTVSENNLFSGLDGTHAVIGGHQTEINFVVDIASSGMSGKDEVFRKCLAIGDSFSGQVTGTPSLQANAGYLYTGYSYSINGIPASVGNLISGSVKVGNTYSTIRYPIGYKSGSRSFYVSSQLGCIITGDDSTGVNQTGIAKYYDYFNSGTLGTSIGYWQDTQFAPTPSEVVNNPWEFSPIYAETQVENYKPRYIRGPYLSYETTFMYPNADLVSQQIEYSAGFPTGVTIVFSIKEETAREVFLVSGLNGAKKHIKVIRAGSDSMPLILETLMNTPFVPNDSSYSYKYDFLRNKTLYPNEGSFFNVAYWGEQLVNENYVPSTDYCQQPELNSTIFGYGGSPFNQGVKITGYLKSRSIYTGKSGAAGNINCIEPAPEGLYWGYRGSKITGNLLYCPPIFDLSSYSLNVTPELNKAMFENIWGSTFFTSSLDGKIEDQSLYSDNGYYGYNGKDPLFYEYVGGRSGQGAELEGGYHSKGIIGDSWYKVSCSNFGEASAYCYGTYYYRYPESDNYLLLSNLTPTGLNIFARGLSYYPFHLNWTYQPYKTSSIGSIGVTTTAKEVRKADFYFSFDMMEKFYPLKSGDANLRYVSSGVTIGPFDRDVELCITGGPLVPSGSLVIDGVQLSNPEWIGDCNHPLTNLTRGTGIIRGENGRLGTITTFRLIPSGKTANINISGTGLIGVSKSSIVTIRPRTCIGAAATWYCDPLSLSGDIGYMDGLKYINNGSETRFSFPANSFNDLVGKTFSATTTPREIIMYPKPPAGDFDVVLSPTISSLGNKTYKKNPTREYWKVRNPNQWFTGVREVSRIHISIDSVVVDKGYYPYQTYQTMVPSGTCRISGSFGYTGQAESAIISDGIVLSGISGASSLSGIFMPTYVSPVLERIPTGIFQLPSGSGIRPVLPAPSYMKIRENPYVISGGDKYVSYAPDSGLNYNAFLWPAWSDLGLLNPELVYEQIPPEDGNVFLDSYLTFSAAKGQSLASGKNPEENVTYRVVAQYAMIDSVATDPYYNTGKCIFSGEVNKTTLTSGDLSGILTSEGNSLTMALNLKNFKV